MGSVHTIKKERYQIPKIDLTIVFLIKMKVEFDEPFETAIFKAAESTSDYTFERIEQSFKEIEQALELYEMMKTRILDEEYTLDEENSVVAL